MLKIFAISQFHQRKHFPLRTNGQGVMNANVDYSFKLNIHQEGKSTCGFGNRANEDMVKQIRKLLYGSNCHLIME